MELASSFSETLSAPLQEQWCIQIQGTDRCVFIKSTSDDGGRGRLFHVIAMKSSNPQLIQGKNYIPTHNLRGLWVSESHLPRK